MDLDGNSSVDVNEFFEVFRLVDAMDGKLDGKQTPIEVSARSTQESCHAKRFLCSAAGRFDILDSARNSRSDTSDPGTNDDDKSDTSRTSF